MPVLRVYRSTVLHVVGCIRTWTNFNKKKQKQKLETIHQHRIVSTLENRQRISQKLENINHLAPELISQREITT